MGRAAPCAAGGRGCGHERRDPVSNRARPWTTLAVGLLFLAVGSAEPGPATQAKSDPRGRAASGAVKPAANFPASAVAWFLPPRPDPRPYARHNIPLGNRCRIPIESFIDVIDEATGRSERYVLTFGHPSEWVFAENRMFQMPSNEWRAVYSLTEQRGMGRGYTYKGEPRRGHPVKDTFASLDIQIPTFARTHVLEKYADIDEAIWKRVPLVGRTEIRDPNGRKRYVIEYPIGIVNSMREMQKFQVDTGPLLVPDFESKAERDIDRLEMACIIYNRLDRAEFILRRPTPIKDESGREVAKVLEYSEIREYPARTWILTGSDR
jgi:hypothetical protein